MAWLIDNPGVLYSKAMLCLALTITGVENC